MNAHDYLIPGILAIALLNVPFGYWRSYATENNKRLEWVLAIHLPVPAVFIARKLSGISLSMHCLPYIALYIVAFFMGQRIGSLFHSKLATRLKETSRCMFVDFLRLRGSKYGRSRRKSLRESR